MGDFVLMVGAVLVGQGLWMWAITKIETIVREYSDYDDGSWEDDTF